MVTVIKKFDPRIAAGEALGSGLGSGFQKAAETILPQEYQRARMQQALQSLNMPQGASPSETLKALLSATAGIPDQGKIVSALYEPLLRETRASIQAAPETEKSLAELQNKYLSSGVSQKRGVGAGFKQEAEEISKDQIIENVRTKYPQYFPTVKGLEEVEPSKTRTPQKPPEPYLPLKPQDKAKIRSQLKKDAITDPQLQDEYIKEIEQSREAEYKAAREGFANVQAYQEAQQKEDNRFFEYADPFLKKEYPNMTPERLNIWRGISKLQENAGPDPSRMRGTNAIYSSLFGPLESFEKTGPFLPYASLLSKEAVKDSLDQAKSIVDMNMQRVMTSPELKQNEPLRQEILNSLRNEYRRSMIEKDFGTAQAAYAVSDINPKLKSSIPKAPMSSPKTPEGLGLAGIPTISGELYYQGKPEVRENNIEKLTQALLNNLQEQDSLLLVREQAIANNHDEAAFKEALRRAINRGLVLSDFQRAEQPELDIPQRIDLTTILRGKKSVFDIFKRKQ